MFVTRVVSSMSIHCQNNTHVSQGKPIRRRPAVVFRATEMRFPARATSRLALAPSLRSGARARPVLFYRFYRLPCTTFTLYNLS